MHESSHENLPAIGFQTPVKRDESMTGPKKKTDHPNTVNLRRYDWKTRDRNNMEEHGIPSCKWELVIVDKLPFFWHSDFLKP